MPKEIDGHSVLMARLTISALDEAVKDPNSWKDPLIHRALLVSGLSVLIASTKLINKDLELL